jgi:hypothetical protein
VTRDERIRIVYLKRRRFARAYAARVLGRSVKWVEANRFEAERGGFLAWEEVVLLGNDLWTHQQIERALGDRAAHILPPLARLVTLTVRLPKHIVVALRHVARREHGGVSEIVTDALDGLSLSKAEQIDRLVPGFLEGYAFPYLLEGSRYTAKIGGMELHDSVTP